jgi:hypothetical protein
MTAYLYLPVELDDVDFCIGCPARRVVENFMATSDACGAMENKLIKYTRPEWCPLKEDVE